MKKQYILPLLISFTIIFSCTKEENETYVPIKDDLPVAIDDIISSTLVTTTEIEVLNNDITGDPILPNSLNIVGGIDTDSNTTLDRLVKAGEGTWNTTTIGAIIFTPEMAFTGNPTPIKYKGKDKEGNFSNEAGVAINAIPIANVDPSLNPYQNLSSYKFFVGNMKDQLPSMNVLPYEPASSLFTDYAHKKRFVWMPTGTKATNIGDTKTLELPVGAVLIKTFYYDNVQNVSPRGARRIIETRIMIRKASGWVFAEYVWNASQTEATLDLNGSFTPIEWIDEDNITKSTNYRLPNLSQCVICHKTSVGTTTTNIPIGIKPQNLNFNYNYGTETKNQLTKWIEKGYLQGNFTLPTPENSTINYNDPSIDISLRARSYVDINCAHCHQTERHCEYRPMRFAFNETGVRNGEGLQKMGVCVPAQDVQGGVLSNYPQIITPRNIEASMLYYRISTTNETYRMPLHGRTLVHTEGVALMREWINSLEQCQE